MIDSPLLVLAVHRMERGALLSDDRTVPVTHWFGVSGEDCHPMAAATCVCGSDSTGWFAVDLLNFCPAQVH